MGYVNLTSGLTTLGRMAEVGNTPRAKGPRVAHNLAGVNTLTRSN